MSTARIHEHPGGGSIRVQSRSNPNVQHEVDPRAQTCSCRGFSYRRECYHLRVVNAPEYTITRAERFGRVVYEIHGPDGWEGSCPSFADAFEVITLDLGGVLGAPGIGGYCGGAA